MLFEIKLQVFYPCSKLALRERLASPDELNGGGANHERGSETPGKRIKESSLQIAFGIAPSRSTILKQRGWRVSCVGVVLAGERGSDSGRSYSACPK